MQRVREKEVKDSYGFGIPFINSKLSDGEVAS